MEGRAGRPTWLFPWAQTNATWEIPRTTTKGPSGFYEERLSFVTLSIRSNTQEPLCDDDQEAAAMARLTVSEGAYQQPEKPDLLIEARISQTTHLRCGLLPVTSYVPTTTAVEHEQPDPDSSAR